jgi:L-ribulose-5-phosphate 3-epimerase
MELWGKEWYNHGIEIMEVSSMNISLMTTSMVFPLVAQLQAGRSLDEVKAKYAEMLDMIADCGIPAVEVTSLELDVFGVETVRDALSRSGLVCSSVIHMDAYAQTDQANHDGIVDTAKKKILDAKALGAGYVMLALMAQPDIEKHSAEKLREALIGNIRPIAEFGKEQGITVSVEDTPDIRLPLCDSADLALVLEAIPELALTYDTGNMLFKNERTLDFYRKLKERVVYVHLKDVDYTNSSDEADRATDGRFIKAVLHTQGVMDFPAIVRELMDNSYDGWLMLEYVGKNHHAEHICAAKKAVETILSGLQNE